MNELLTVENLSDGFIITKQFKNSTEFSLFIEEEVSKRNVTYMDCVLDYCKENDIDPESLKSLINQSLKDKIRVEAEGLNMIKKQGKLVF